MVDVRSTDQETRDALKAMGFEPPSAGGNFTNRRGYWVWQPGSFQHNPDHWLADAGHGMPALWDGAGVLFPDPISAATWLLIEASNHG